MELKLVRLLLILLLGLWGCLTEPDCFDTSTNRVTFAFYNAQDKATQVEVDSIAISGVAGFLIPENNTFSAISLPLNPAETAATVTFYFGDAPETVSLSYRLQTEVVSEDCGALAYLTDLSLADSSFETITILNKRLATNAGTNVKIFVE
ncbi:MAG: hypothetical protein KIT62_16860 [Cyclobacteriaceae bacterium]|nr:hypothetical protein [Cyclobacteriaceae bacterium]